MKPCEIYECTNGAACEAEVTTKLALTQSKSPIVRPQYVLLCDTHAALLRTPLIGKVWVVSDRSWYEIVKVIEIGNPMLLREHMP
jgi:hypothetical protein